MREPEFDERQRSLLLAHRALMADIGPHGVPMSEATSPDANPARHGGHRYVSPDLPRVDYVAREKKRAEDAYFKKYPKAERAGLFWTVQRVETPIDGD